MSKNYYAFTCLHAEEDGYCIRRRDYYSYRICKNCHYHENNGNNQFADEDEYNECYEEQAYYYSNRWKNDNPDGDDIADYYGDH